jgi:HlyD family secretion protein
MMMSSTDQAGLVDKAERSAKASSFRGFVVIFLVFGGIGLWAATTNISGAVVSSGVVVVESEVKKVQHPTGGVVSEILVANGSTVKAGDLLIRLDETVNLANLHMINKQLDELVMREARLEAERDGAVVVTVPARFEQRETEADVAKRIAGELAFFQSRRLLIIGERSQFGEQIVQLKEQINGFTRQLAAKAMEIGIVNSELTNMLTLEEQRLVTAMRVNQLKRDVARLEGDRGYLEASLAQTKGKIAEIEVEILRIDQQFRSSTIEELRDNLAQQAELTERGIAAEDALRRVEIRAPHSGKVHELAVHTVGGVVNPGEPIMLIVPEGEELIIEAKISPSDIDLIENGQKTAFVRLPAFDHHSTPELNGTLVGASADITIDPYSGQPYFTARISVSRDELEKLGNKRLVPGMPAEVFIRTEDRTVLSYLAKPIENQISRAFRER